MEEDSGFTLNFPVFREEKIIETPLMREVIRRTLTTHPGNSVWYGLSRIGKTTTARRMVEKIEAAYENENPFAFRAIHFELGEIAPWSGNEQKKGLKSLHNAALGRIDSGLYQFDPVETVCEQVVYGLIRKNIQIVFLDEAGNLSLDAIRGILMAFDAAKNLGHRLSFVFIGMDDLPVKVTKLPQINGRIHEWCYFQPYDFNAVAELLAALHSHFATLDMKKPGDHEQVQFIYDSLGGFPGHIIPFIRKVERYQEIIQEPIDTRLLRAVHLRTILDKEQSIQTSSEIYKGKPYKQPASLSGKSEGGTRGGKTQGKERTSVKKSKSKRG